MPYCPEVANETVGTGMVLYCSNRSRTSDCEKWGHMGWGWLQPSLNTWVLSWRAPLMDRKASGLLAKPPFRVSGRITAGGVVRHPTPEADTPIGCLEMRTHDTCFWLGSFPENLEWHESIFKGCPVPYAIDGWGTSGEMPFKKYWSECDGLSTCGSPLSMFQSWEIKGKVMIVLCSVYPDVKVRKAGRRRRGGIRLPGTAFRREAWEGWGVIHTFFRGSCRFHFSSVSWIGGVGRPPQMLA